MTSIRKQRHIAVSAEAAWDALRDWSHVHERLVPGFVTDSRPEGDDRVLTFFNGTVARERMVGCSESERRLVWAVVDGRFTHYNGAAEVIEEANGAIRFVWTVDLLPDELGPAIEQMVDRGIETIKQTLERA